MFKLKRINNTAVCAPAIKEMVATAATYAIGDALVISSGKLAKAGATATPEFICAAKKTVTTTDTELAAYPVENNQEYETVLSTDGSLVIGSKVTLSSTSDSVTATTTSGVAEIVAAEGSTAGSVVVVKF